MTPLTTQVISASAFQDPTIEPSYKQLDWVPAAMYGLQDPPTMAQVRQAQDAATAGNQDARYYLTGLRVGRATAKALNVARQEGRVDTATALRALMPDGAMQLLDVPLFPRAANPLAPCPSIGRALGVDDKGNLLANITMQPISRLDFARAQDCAMQHCGICSAFVMGVQQGIAGGQALIAAGGDL